MLTLLSRRFHHLSEAPRNFPWPCLILLVLTVLILVSTHVGGGMDKLMMALWAIVPWLIAVRLWQAPDAPNRTREHAYSIGLLIFSLSVAWLAGNFLRAGALLFLSGLFAMLVAPYFGRGRAARAPYCQFQLGLVTSTLFAFLSALILCLGLSAILASLEYLFGVPIPTKLYTDIWTIGMVLLGPIWFMGNLGSAPTAADAPYPRWAHFILTYLLAPMVFVYMAILYAYAVKIALAGDLPKNQLGLMASLFGLVGVATHYLSQPLLADGRSLRLLSRIFYPALVLPLGLLWLAIGTRVADYGITEDRYALMLIALWLSVVTALHLLRRANMALWTPAIAAIMMLLASFGPWGVEGASIRSQRAELESLLRDHGILQDGRVTPARDPEAIPMQDRARIADIVRYFTRSNRQAGLNGLATPAVNNQYHTDPMKVMAQWNIPYANGARGSDNGQLYFTRLNAQDGTPMLLSIAGYDLASELLHFNFFSKTAPEPILLTAEGHTVQVSTDRQQITVQQGGESVTFDLLPLVRHLADTVGVRPMTPEASARMSLRETRGKLRVQLDVQSLNVRYEGNDPKMQSISFRLLLAF